MRKFRFPVGDGTREDFEKRWYIAQGFGNKTDYGYHEGIDINLKTGGDTDLGEKLYAIADWQLKYYHLKSHVDRGFGIHFVYEVESPWGKRWIHYAHCQNIKFDPNTNPSGNVGDILAEIGKSGRPRNIMPAHLHLAIFKKDPIDLPNGIDTIATTRSKLNDWWEDPLPFLNDWYERDNMMQEENKVSIKDIINDSYSALTGQLPSQDEVDWRLKSWISVEELLKSLTGDGRFYKIYIKPQLENQKLVLEDAHKLALKEQEEYWQKEVESAKQQQEKRIEALIAKNAEMSWADILEIVLTKLKKRR